VPQPLPTQHTLLAEEDFKDYELSKIRIADGGSAPGGTSTVGV
jgi:hypothetical protein